MKAFLKTGFLALAVASATAGCESDLLVNNPNQPTPDVLLSEEGIKRQATGIYRALDNGLTFPWLVSTFHDGMGDAIPSAVGNFGFVDMMNPEQIIFSDGTVQNPPAVRGGPPQREWIAQNNNRTTTTPAINYEWQTMYRVNNEANLILQFVDQATFGDNAEAKRQGYRAWAHFWKGYAYSRIGSIYERGIITDVYNQTNNQYRTTAEMIAEANRQFDLAIQNAAGINAIAADVVPALFTAIPNATSFVQAANTMKARNILVNTYRDEMTQAQWQQVEQFAAAGLRSNANTFQLRFNNTPPTFGDTGTILYRTGALGPVWSYVSQRIAQEYLPGDQRIQRTGQTNPNAGVVEAAPAYPIARGFNHITSVRGREPIFETAVGSSRLFLVSAEENLLMEAEAKLALGQPGAAAAAVNQVRALQGAGLPDLTAATITFEDIRRERRVALLARGLAFYDARRWRVILPQAQGGGRTGAHVWRGLNGPLDTNATIIYNFRPYWPVPAQETTFNPGPNQAPT